MEAELYAPTQTGDTAFEPAAAPAEPKTRGPRAQARLLEYAPGRFIALPPHTTYALVETPAIAAVPGAARHACGLLTWQGARLPMIDLSALLDPDARAARAPRYALIVAWQRAPRTPLEHGAIALDALPQTIAVGDEAYCPLPDDSPLWPLLAMSCFSHEGQAVPILDTARLFAAQPY